MTLKDYQNRKIRLETNRWEHINENHPETIGQVKLIEDTLFHPDYIQEGNNKEFLAIKRFFKTPVSENKYCVVVYKVMGLDGFIITSYFTRRPSFKRKLIWKKQ